MTGITHQCFHWQSKSTPLFVAPPITKPDLSKLEGWGGVAWGCWHCWKEEERPALDLHTPNLNMSPGPGPLKRTAFPSHSSLMRSNPSTSRIHWNLNIEAGEVCLSVCASVINIRNRSSLPYCTVLYTCDTIWSHSFGHEGGRDGWWLNPKVTLQKSLRPTHSAS